MKMVEVIMLESKINICIKFYVDVIEIMGLFLS